MWVADGITVLPVLGRDHGPMRVDGPALDYRTRPEPIPTALWETPWMIWCLWRFLRRERVDVLWCPGNTYSIVCVAMRLLLGPACPPILATISNDLERRDMPGPVRWFYHRWLRLQAPHFARIVAMAPSAVEEITTFMRVPHERVAVIENPAIREADLRPGVRRHVGSGSRRFVAVGRLERQKNLPLMLEAFAAGKRPGDTLTILGEGTQRRSLEGEIARLGLADSVALPGFAADAPERIAEHDALLLSSDYEGLGNVIVEALARGVPVITTSCSSTTPHLMAANAMGPSPHGWLVSVRDRAGLAGAIAAFDSTSFECESALAMARSFTLEKAALAYLAEMQALVRSSHRSEDLP